MQPLAKDVWHLGEPIADGGRGEKIYENLEALSGEASDRPLEGRPGNNKKSAHRVAELGSNAEPGEAICDPADRYAPKIPLSDATARGVPAADDYIEALFFDGAEHSRERRLVMLEVGIDDRQVWRAARKHSFDDRSRQAAAADPLDTADARIGLRKTADLVSGTIGESSST
jgi:hypothetical protein